MSEGVPDDTSVISDLVITIRSGSKTWLNVRESLGSRAAVTMLTSNSRSEALTGGMCGVAFRASCRRAVWRW